MSRHALYSMEVVSEEKIVLRDLWTARSNCMTITNDAEHVVEDLVSRSILRPGMRLFYYDTENQLDELLVKDGKFAGFAPGPPPGRG